MQSILLRKTSSEYMNTWLQRVECVLNAYPLQCVQEVRLFGSYARGTQKGTSDLDILAICDKLPDNVTKGCVYEDLDEINVDIVFYTREVFENSNSRFSQNLRKDSILLWKRTVI